MPPNPQTIRAQWQIINDEGSRGLTAVSEFITAKTSGGDALTPAQKQTYRTNFTAALTAVEAAAAAIRAELAIT